MSMREFIWALKLTNISPAAKLVAIYVGDNYSQDGSRRFSYGELAEFACVDVAAIPSILEEFEDKNIAFRHEALSVCFEFPLEKLDEVSQIVSLDRSRLYLYVMSCGDHVKIGITVNLRNRQASLQTQAPFPVLLEWSGSGEAHRVRRIERQIHDALKDTRITGEWFKISLEQAIEAARLHLADKGERHR